jgi:hypothetical protein
MGFWIAGPYTLWTYVDVLVLGASGTFAAGALAGLACARRAPVESRTMAPMEYALLIYLPEAWERLSDEERASYYEEYARMRDEPGWLGGAELQSVDRARTVRVEGGETLISDGPFADTKEVFGGYFLFDAEDIESAARFAAKAPAARIGGSVEVRTIERRYAPRAHR